MSITLLHAKECGVEEVQSTSVTIPDMTCLALLADRPFEISYSIIKSNGKLSEITLNAVEVPESTLALYGLVEIVPNNAIVNVSEVEA